MILSESAQESLDRYRELDSKYIEVFNDLEKHNEAFALLIELAESRNASIERSRILLKEQMRRAVGENVNQTTAIFGTFTVTPRMSRNWNMDRLLSGLDDMGILEQSINDGAILVDATYETDYAKLSKDGVMQEWIEKGYLKERVDYTANEKLLEATLDSDNYDRIKREAYVCILSQVAVSSPGAIVLK